MLQRWAARVEKLAAIVRLVVLQFWSGVKLVGPAMGGANCTRKRRLSRSATIASAGSAWVFADEGSNLTITANVLSLVTRSSFVRRRSRAVRTPFVGASELHLATRTEMQGEPSGIVTTRGPD
jgi:hypothetical protein